MSMVKSVEGSSALLVLGMHRSGTSALMSVLGRMGWPLGSRLLEASYDNPNGFWENALFVELHERLLAAVGVSWDDPRDLPADWMSTARSEGILAALMQGILEEFGGLPRWAIKDPRICRIVPLWKEALSSLGVNAVYLLALRHPREVAASLRARNGWGYAFGELLWLRHVFDSIESTSGETRCVVVYDRLLADPVNAIGRVVETLSLPSTSADVVAEAVKALDPDDKHHSVIGEVEEETVFSLLATRVYAALDAISAGTAGWGALDGLKREYEELWRSNVRLVEDLMVHTHALRRETAAAYAEIHRLQDVEKSQKDASEALSERLRGALAEVSVTRDALDRSLARLDDVEAAMEASRLAASEAAERIAVIGHQQDRLRSELDSLHAEADSKRSQYLELGNLVHAASEGVALMRAELDRTGSGLSGAVEAIDVLRTEAAGDRQHDRIIHDGLQAQITELRRISDQLARRSILHRLLSALSGAGPFFRRAAKRTVRGILLAWPGDADSKRTRIERVRRFYETARDGTNGPSISWDVDDLAKRRWSDENDAMVASVESGEAALDISVVLYRSERWLDGFIGSLLALDYPLEKIRLLFRDHSPDDATALAFEAAMSGVRSRFADVVYSRGPNLGFGSGHNQNFRAATSPYFLVANVDGQFLPDSLRRLLGVAERSVQTVAAWELRQLPYEHPKYYDPVTMATSWFSGACVMFRASVYRAVGGFDDAIFMYGEDVDLSFRLRARGHELLYVPSARFRHDTYEEPGAFKPIQFHGSTTANLLLRLRFGTFADMLAIPGMWREARRIGREMNAGAGHEPGMISFFRKAPRFFFSRLRYRAMRAPFSRWDYGIRREGAFEHIDEAQDNVPLVSILVRTYRGRGPLLRQALLSIANQTYRNIEAVVVEDKGDTLRDAALAWGEKFGLRVRYFANEAPSSNRCVTGNIALREASGEYCCFLDDDDLLFADHVEYLVSRFPGDGHTPACYALAWEVKIAKDGEDPCRYREVVHSTLPGQRREFDAAILREFNFMPIQSVLFRRDLYALHGGFNTELENLEDWELWRRYSRSGAFRYCPKTTSLYHIPLDAELQTKRQSILDAYYAIAKRIGDEAESRASEKGAQQR